MIFPDDFEVKAHNTVPGAKHWTLKNKDGNTLISVIGGGMTTSGDGVTTFEMLDRRTMRGNDNEPKGNMTKEEINEYLKNNPVIL